VVEATYVIGEVVMRMRIPVEPFAVWFGCVRAHDRRDGCQRARLTLFEGELLPTDHDEPLLVVGQSFFVHRDFLFPVRVINAADPV
jgi:hypothetical protein